MLEALTNQAAMQPANSLARLALSGALLGAFPAGEAEEPGAWLLRRLVQTPWPGTGLPCRGATLPQAKLGGFTSGHKVPELTLNRRQGCKKKSGKPSDLSRADN